MQCVNPSPEAVKLPSGSVLGRFHSVQEEDTGPSLEATTEGPQQSPSQGWRTVPPHTSYNSWACGGDGDGSASNKERQVTAKLLRKYNGVPHRRDHDASLNRAVRHEVPLVAGTVPIRQLLRRLDSRKRNRGSSQPQLDTGDQGQPQQRTGVPPEVTKNFRAKPVLAGDVRELREF